MQRLPRGATAVVHTLFVISLVWSAFFLAWVSLRLIDFCYPLLYDALDIDQHITEYGPQNRYKHGFQATDKPQRLAIFGEIVDAIHDGGNGLEAIRYRNMRGRMVQFLRAPEIIHLRSVARLIGRLEVVSWLMLATLAASFGIMQIRRIPPPRPRKVAARAAAVVAAATVFTFAYGAEAVFNTLHIWVFPAGEQWFFYYQESLMTTLMKAPDLFGAIVALLLAVAALYFGLMVWAAGRLLAGNNGGTSH